MSETRLLPAPSYLYLLRTAHSWGCEDGLLAAGFEPLDGAGPARTCCRGRDPADFARQLWNVPCASPPAGLEVNAPHWHARGFDEAIAEVRSDRDGSPSQLTSRSMQPLTPTHGG